MDVFSSSSPRVSFSSSVEDSSEISLSSEVFLLVIFSFFRFFFNFARYISVFDFFKSFWESGSSSSTSFSTFAAVIPCSMDAVFKLWCCCLKVLLWLDDNSSPLESCTVDDCILPIVYFRLKSFFFSLSSVLLSSSSCWKSVGFPDNGFPFRFSSIPMPCVFSVSCRRRYFHMARRILCRFSSFMSLFSDISSCSVFGMEALILAAAYFLPWFSWIRFSDAASILSSRSEPVLFKIKWVVCCFSSAWERPASVCTYFCVASRILFNCCSRATCLSGFSGILYVSETGAWNCAAFASYFSLEPLYTGCSGT